VAPRAVLPIKELGSEPEQLGHPTSVLGAGIVQGVSCHFDELRDPRTGGGAVVRYGSEALSVRLCPLDLRCDFGYCLAYSLTGYAAAYVVGNRVRQVRLQAGDAPVDCVQAFSLDPGRCPGLCKPLLSQSREAVHVAQEVHQAGPYHCVNEADWDPVAAAALLLAPVRQDSSAALVPRALLWVLPTDVLVAAQRLETPGEHIRG